MRNFNYVLISFSLFCSSAFGQLTNDNSLIHIESKAKVYCQDYVRNENNGRFDNSGNLFLAGDWINNAGNTALINSSKGTVIFNGGNQFITGADLTRFYNLNLDGGVKVKTITVNTEVLNKLDLMDSELQTLGNIMYVTNPNPDSLVWNLGFVSSNDLGGYLARSTNSTSDYLFPVGNAGMNSIYRAVSIRPLSADSNVFAVRLAKINPTFDFSGTSASGANGGFDVAIKDDKLEVLNTEFYHTINRLSGAASADARVYYYDFDGEFNSMAQWGATNDQWNITKFENDTVSGLNSVGMPNRVSQVSGLTDFSHDLFVLANKDNEAVLSIPQFFSPNGDGINDTWDIADLEDYPNNVVKVFNRWGNIVHEEKGYIGGWNGNINASKPSIVVNRNSQLPSGTYFFIIDLGVAGRESYSGFVQIQR